MDLAQLAPLWGYDPLLPREGRLLFFYDYRANPLTHGPKAGVGWNLIWDTTPPDQLDRAPLPAKLGTLNETRFVDDRATARIVADSITCMKPPNDFDVDTPNLEHDEHTQAFDDAWDVLYDIEQGEEITHQLGGWPRTFQYGLREWSELGRNGLHHNSSEDVNSDEDQPQTEHVKEWQLLLQFALDGPDHLFQNGGAIYVMMWERDMRSRAFDQAWVICQCD